LIWTTLEEYIHFIFIFVSKENIKMILIPSHVETFPAASLLTPGQSDEKMGDNEQ
jgi:hypothetical protein